MYCSKCGAQNDDNAYKCTTCGAVLQQGSQSVAPPARVSNYLVPAILCTVFCCLPCGIPAIVFAAQVNAKLSAGDMEGAAEASKKAKIWCLVALGLGLVGGVIYGMIIILGGLFES